MMTVLMNEIRGMRVQLGRESAAGAAGLLSADAQKLESAARTGRRANSMSEEAARVHRIAAQTLQTMAAEIRRESPADGAAAFAVVKRVFDAENDKLKKSAAGARLRRPAGAVSGFARACRRKRSRQSATTSVVP
jgi:hypothetical protein